MFRSRVLIVDDHHAVRETLRLFLQANDYVVFEAANAGEALHILRSTPPDIVLTDLRMEGLDGIELCRLIRTEAHGREVPILIFTHDESRETKIQALEAGADEFLSKPLDLDEILLRLDNLLRFDRFGMLVRERQKFQTLFSSLQDGVLVCDCSGEVLIANESARALLNGRSLFEATQKPRAPQWRRQIAQLCRGQVQSVQMDGSLTVDGQTRVEVEATLNPMEFQGRAAALIILRNVTERNSLREQAERGERLNALGRATAGVIHDFNNLIQVIEGDAEELLARLGDDHDAREELQEILDVTARSGELARQLLNYSRHGRSGVQKLDLNQIVQDSTPIIRHMSGRKNILDFGLHDGALTIDGDASEITQVLTNLVVNSRDAFRDNGHISLQTFVHEGSDGEHWAGVEVRDDGPGIPEKIQTLVFEPFFTTKSASGGTGLGLAMVREIVRRHGGQVQLASNAEDGTSVRLLFPLRDGMRRRGVDAEGAADAARTGELPGDSRASA